MTIAEASMGILLDRNVPVSKDWMPPDAYGLQPPTSIDADRDDPDRCNPWGPASIKSEVDIAVVRRIRRREVQTMLLDRKTLTRLKALATISVREVRELAHAALVRRRVRALYAITGPHPTREMLIAIVDSLRSRYGVDAVCAELPIGPQDYYASKSSGADSRWRRLLAQARSHRNAGSSPATNPRPVGICSVEPSSAVPTG